MWSEGNSASGRAEVAWDISEAGRDSRRESSFRSPSMKRLGSLKRRVCFSFSRVFNRGLEHIFLLFSF